jgi:hypothetical protein
LNWSRYHKRFDIRFYSILISNELKTKIIEKIDFCYVILVIVVVILVVVVFVFYLFSVFVIFYVFIIFTIFIIFLFYIFDTIIYE